MKVRRVFEERKVYTVVMGHTHVGGAFLKEYCFNTGMEYDSFNRCCPSCKYGDLSYVLIDVQTKTNTQGSLPNVWGKLEPLLKKLN